ncbi:MAG: Calcineurin-like phosphoesterase [Bacteroidetes bacterium ADurb.Bin408]|nr:MAG: Calcineurin-like phosphoesterase [Bacteroidetes bacterium ADurb.Bin408]
MAIKEKFTELYGPNWYNKVNLILHTGDMVGDGSNLVSYETEYFNPFSVLSCSVPFMISIGNHEGENNYFYNYMHYEDFSTYQYPNSLCEKYYAFNLGNVQFLAMNMAGAYDNGAQKQWVKNRLDESAANPDIDYVFAYAHRPGRSELWPDGNASFVYDSIYPLFATYPKLAMHSFGHSHNYEHGTYINNNSENRDFRTILAGGAGGALDRWDMYPNQVDLRDVQVSYDHYCYVIVDVDLSDHSYTASMYSLGNPEYPLYNVLLDKWHSVVGCDKPQTPQAAYPGPTCPGTAPTLIASLFSGADSLMSSRFQLITASGDFNTPLLDTLRDWTNIYGVTPTYVPVDKNTGMGLRRLKLPAGLLQIGNSYKWRVSYRDHNCRWSDWSAPADLLVQPQAADSIDFVADTLYGIAPLTVHFTDLSSVTPTAWLWDFDNDGTFDSPLQDPVWTYTNDGVYTVNLVVSYNGSLGYKLKTSYIVVGASSNDELDALPLQIYPNPAKDYVMVHPQAPLNQPATIEISDISGRALLQHHTLLQEDVKISLNTLSKGVYIIHVKTPDKIWKKLIMKY